MLALSAFYWLNIPYLQLLNIHKYSHEYFCVWRISNGTIQYDMYFLKTIFFLYFINRSIYRENLLRRTTWSGLDRRIVFDAFAMELWENGNVAEGGEDQVRALSEFSSRLIERSRGII